MIQPYIGEIFFIVCFTLFNPTSTERLHPPLLLVIRYLMDTWSWHSRDSFFGGQGIPKSSIRKTNDTSSVPGRVCRSIILLTASTFKRDLKLSSIPSYHGTARGMFAHIKQRNTLFLVLFSNYMPDKYMDKDQLIAAAVATRARSTCTITILDTGYKCWFGRRVLFEAMHNEPAHITHSTPKFYRPRGQATENLSALCSRYYKLRIRWRPALQIWIFRRTRYRVDGCICTC